MKKIINIDVVLIIIIVVLAIANISVILKINIINKTINEYYNENKISDDKINDKKIIIDELEKLQQMTERDRMEYYFSEFISYIQSKEYTKAYELLYPEFRDKYFKTQEEFKNYVKKLYPESVGFSYNDIQRQGDIYVLLITVIDTNKNVGQEKEQRIVIKESNFNDFAISFQVI